MASRQALSKTILVLLASILAGCAGVVSSNSSGGTPDMPAISGQPTSQTVTTGQAATFGVTANGAAPLGYQWRKNSTNIGGATGATYITPATTASDNGTKFDVVVSNAKGSVTSSAATLTVNAAAVAPTITTQPASKTVTAGQTATFTVAATGTAPLSYQWQKNGSAISGAIASTYTTPVTTTSDSGSSFTVVVTNSKGNVTSAGATLTVNAAVVAPAITAQPTSQTVTAGQTATFSVAASGTAPLGYQWKKNGTNISGATSSSYSTPATTTGDSGSSFTVTVSNTAGSVTSSGATLTVTAAAVAPTVTTQPASITVTAGQAATFSVTASGTAPLGYQWKKNGTAIGGATSSTYTTPATTTADSSAVFSVVISNTAGSVTSGPATLTVNAAVVAPTITTQPASITVTAGQTATFSVTASGTAPLGYQWKKNGTAIGGATSSTYTTPATTAADSSAVFNVVINNTAGSATSGPATLTVNAAVVAPTITTQPASITVTAGQTATFSVTASGTAPLGYQWKKNGTAIGGATSSTYTTPATTAADSSAVFSVVISNTAGSVTSGPATLTVNAAVVAPTITTQPASITVTAGQTATFTVAATGTAPLSYQWQKNGSAISGAIASTYTTPATTTSDSGSSFTVVVTNSKGNVTSAGGTLTVSAAVVAPAITAQPTSQTVTAGQTATFSVVASGTAPLGYQWKKNGTNISGATSSSYSTPATTTGDSGSSFTVTVSNTAGSVTSSGATLTVTAAAVAPTVTTQPANVTVTAGQTATFSVAASGTAPLGYQWKKNGANISGATGSTYTTPATTTGDSGSSFTVVVSNTAGSATSGPATLTVNAAAVAPTITTQPASITVTAGQTATFSVAASGTAPLGYQWKKNGANISGATSSSYSTPATTTGDSGSSFTVTVSNTAGSVTSNAAILTVNPAPVAPAITAQPSSQTVTAGQTATFMVAATGTAPLGYQWKKNGTNISGATGSTYTTPATTTGDSGSSFTVVVSNTAGSVTSSAATLTVNAAVVAPTITTQPASITVTAGQTATFSVTASGTAPLGYQWKKNGTAIGGATSSTYTTPATTTADSSAVFSVVISNTAGSVTSGPATLTVNAAVVAPTITTQPASITVTAGQTATFTVVAAGTGPLTYQWQKNGANISGGTASYTTAPTSTSDNGTTFVVTVSNSQGSVTSAVATLTVNPAQVVAPTITTGPASQSVVAGQTATFSVVATGTAPLTYQWQKSSTNISGANGSSYTTPATSTADNGSTYTVTVSNSAGSATSDPATLTVTAGSQKTYSTTFPLTESVISENGNWINGKTNGVLWKDVSTVSGQAFGTENGSTMYDDSTAVLTGTWNSDQMAQATVHTVNQNGGIFEEVELRLRTSITANSITGYEFNFRCTSDGSQYAQIVRWNGPLGSFTLLDSRSGPGLHNGDVIKATAKGNTLTIYLNGTALFSVTDSTFTNGSPGIGFYNQNGTTSNNKDYGFTSFSAADNI